MTALAVVGAAAAGLFLLVVAVDARRARQRIAELEAALDAAEDDRWLALGVDPSSGAMWAELLSLEEEAERDDIENAWFEAEG